MKTFDTFYSEYRDRLNSSVQEIASEMSGGPYSPSEFAGKLIAANQMVTLPVPVCLWLFKSFLYSSSKLCVILSFEEV